MVNFGIICWNPFYKGTVQQKNVNGHCLPLSILFLGTPITTFEEHTTDLNCDDDDGAGVDLPSFQTMATFKSFFSANAFLKTIAMGWETQQECSYRGPHPLFCLCLLLSTSKGCLQSELSNLEFKQVKLEFHQCFPRFVVQKLVIILLKSGITMPDGQIRMSVAALNLSVKT